MAKREILSREWNKKNKRWPYGYYVVDGGEHLTVPGVSADDLAFYEDHAVEADGVGQYTGVKDAEGVKVSGGDIIASQAYPYITQYREEYSQSVAVSKPGVTITFYQQWVNECGLTVIGNVHGEPELIKAG